MGSTTTAITIADRALLLARSGWPAEDDARLWECFAPGWRRTLRDGSGQLAGRTAEEARDRLRQEHQAEARPDLGRVHPSWWIRALKDETPAVQRAVVAGAPASMRETLRDGLGLKEEDLATDRRPLADALRATLALWSERLIGDVADRDDPPVIAALARDDPRDVARLIHTLGLTKYACASAEPEGLAGGDLQRLRELQGSLGALPLQFEQQARRDVEKVGPAGRQAVDRLGLLTIARLLDVAEPYRVRWALQHLPYPVAKLTRTLMSARTSQHASLVSWESQVFGLAQEWVRAEGRQREPRGGAS